MVEIGYMYVEKMYSIYGRTAIFPPGVPKTALSFVKNYYKDMKQIVSKKTIRNWLNQYDHICEQVNIGNGWKNSCNTGPDIKNPRIF